MGNLVMEKRTEYEKNIMRIVKNKIWGEFLNRKKWNGIIYNKYNNDF